MRRFTSTLSRVGVSAMTRSPFMMFSTSSQSPLKVLVVGGTGFLGRKIVNNLLKEQNVRVQALSRRGGAAAGGVELVKGDMMDPASLDKALENVDVVVSSANGYMKGNIAVDFQGNKNLVEAAARSKIKKFVFLSITTAEEAKEVPHFWAKAVVEDLLQQQKVPFVSIRAPAFIDQDPDIVGDNVKKGRFIALGDTTTKWSLIYSDDLASYLAKAASSQDPSMLNKQINVGWKERALSNEEIRNLLARITKKDLSMYTVPWFLMEAFIKPMKWLKQELAHDLLLMFKYYKTGKYVVPSLEEHERYFGPAPTAMDALTRYAKDKKLI